MSKILKVLIFALVFVQTYSYSMDGFTAADSCFSPERKSSGHRVAPNSAERQDLHHMAVLLTAVTGEGDQEQFSSPQKKSCLESIASISSPLGRTITALNHYSAEKIIVRAQGVVAGKKGHLKRSRSERLFSIPSPTRVAEAFSGGDFSDSEALPIKDLASFFGRHRELALLLIKEVVGLSSSELQSPPGKKSSAKMLYPQSLLCTPLSEYIKRLAAILVSSDGQPHSSAAFGNLIEQVMAEGGTLCKIIVGLGLVQACIANSTVIKFTLRELEELGITLPELKELGITGDRDVRKLKTTLLYWNMLAHKYLSTRDSTIPAPEQIIYQLKHYFQDLSSSSSCIPIDIGGLTICSSLILEILRDGIYSGCVEDEKVSGGSRDLCSGVDIAAGAISSSGAREFVEDHYGEALKTSWQRCLIQNEEERSSNGRSEQLFSFERKSPSAMLAYTLIMQMLTEEGFTDLTYEEPGHGSLAITAKRAGAFSKGDPYYFIRFNSTAKPGDTHPNLGQIIINIEYVCGDQKLNGHLGIVDPRDMGIVFQRISKEITKVEPNSAKKRSGASCGGGGGGGGGGDDEGSEFCGLFGGGDDEGW